jgi:hypothetical protein
VHHKSASRFAFSRGRTLPSPTHHRVCVCVCASVRVYAAVTSDPFGLFIEEQEICAGLHLPTVDEEDARRKGQRHSGSISSGSTTAAVVSSLKGMFSGPKKVCDAPAAFRILATILCEISCAPLVYRCYEHQHPTSKVTSDALIFAASESQGECEMLWAKLAGNKVRCWLGFLALHFHGVC